LSYKLIKVQYNLGFLVSIFCRRKRIWVKNRLVRIKMTGTGFQTRATYM